MAVVPASPVPQSATSLEPDLLAAVLAELKNITRILGLMAEDQGIDLPEDDAINEEDLNGNDEGNPAVRRQPRR